MSKIKLVPCPGIKKHEVLTRMMNDGETFKYIKPQSEGNFPPVFEDLHYDKNHTVNPFRLGTNQWNFRGLKYLHEIVEQKWYEDPDMVGKAMKVRQHLKDIWTNDIFVGMLKGRYVGFFDNYAHAEPLTAADLYQGEV